MISRKCLWGLACLCAAVAMSGCIIVESESVPIEVAEIEVGCAPPPPPAAIVTRPAPPSRFHIWIDGHYVVRSGAWVWAGGHWERPPHSSVIWVPGHTRQHGHVWLWRPGHWH